MTTDELNSIPLYSKVGIYWGSYIAGVLLKVTGDKAIVYIPNQWQLMYDYPASGITLIEAFQPYYTAYSNYGFDTIPLYSTVSISLVNKTGIIINKDSNSQQLHIFYPDTSMVEWVRMEYVTFVTAPGTKELIKPIEQFVEAVQPPGVVRTQTINVDPYTYVEQVKQGVNPNEAVVIPAYQAKPQAQEQAVIDEQVIPEKQGFKVSKLMLVAIVALMLFLMPKGGE